MTGLLDALTGPLGGLLAGLVAVAGALLWGRRQGARGERERRAGQDATDYVKERQAIDESDLGHGASDAERVRMLTDIANRRVGRKD